MPLFLYVRFVLANVGRVTVTLLPLADGRRSWCGGGLPANFKNIYSAAHVHNFRRSMVVA